MADEEMQNQEEKIVERSGLPKEEVLAQLRARLLQEGQRKLKDEYGTPRGGIVTGLDEAFIVDNALRDALIAADPRSAELLKPYATADSITRWSGGESTAWIIHTVPGQFNIDDYPAIRQHLEQFKDRLVKRSSGGQWFELSRAEQPAAKKVVDLQIVFPQRSDWPDFTLQPGGTYFCDAGFHIPNGDYYLTGMLNSRLFWFLMQGMSEVGQDGVVNLRPEYLERLPWPMPHVDDISWIGSYSDFCHRTAAERNEFNHYMRGEIAKNLAPGGSVAELNTEMLHWHALSADTLHEAALRRFGKGIAADMMQTWDDFLSNGRHELNRLNMEIISAERKLDLVVYRMFELTEEEIEYLDRTY